jgi:hypothetical protein
VPEFSAELPAPPKFSSGVPKKFEHRLCVNLVPSDYQLDTRTNVPLLLLLVLLLLASMFLPLFMLLLAPMLLQEFLICCWPYRY